MDKHQICGPAPLHKADSDFPLTVYEFQRNSRGEMVRIALDVFNGHKVFSIRAFYESADGSWRPAKGGINLSIKKIETLHQALSAAIAQAEALGWLGNGRTKEELVGQVGQATPTPRFEGK